MTLLATNLGSESHISSLHKSTSIFYYMYPQKAIYDRENYTIVFIRNLFLRKLGWRISKNKRKSKKQDRLRKGNAQEIRNIFRLKQLFGTNIIILVKSYILRGETIKGKKIRKQGSYIRGIHASNSTGFFPPRRTGFLPAFPSFDWQL